MQISKSELEQLYRSHTNAAAAKILGVSRQTLGELIKKAGICLKGKGNRDNSDKRKISLKNN